MLGIRRKGEACRPPGALANSARPESLQSLGHPAHRRAREAAAALGRSKMIADDFLHSRDAVAECREVPFSSPGKDLHQRPATDLARRVGGEMAAAGERTRSASPCAPSIRGSRIRRTRQSRGKLDARHDRRDIGARPAAGVDRQAAALEQRMRRRPSARRDRAGARRSRASSGRSGKSTKRGPNRERELGPGAEPGMRGNGLRDCEPLAGVNAKAFGDAERERAARSRSSPTTSKRRSFAKLERGSRTRRWRDRSIRTVGQDPR